MPTAAEAGRNQLQAYLEQLYSKSPFYQNLISPQNTKNLLISGQAYQDSRPPVGNSNSVGKSLSSMVPKNTSSGSRKGRGSNPNIDALKARLANNGAGGGMATYPSISSARPTPNYVIPNMNLKPNPVRPSQIGTPNQTVINLEKARSVIENRPHGQSLGKSSYDLDPNLQGQNPADLSALEAEIRALSNQPDIPGQWISPYSQEYLNSLGDRLGQAGSDAQAQFQAAIGDVTNNYGAMTDSRNSANAQLINELQGSGANIGVNYANSNQGQQAASDADYLNQTAAANQATDTSFMSKLGELAQFYGGNLGAQAREGLLTPKQWQGPQSGMDAGEQALFGFLNDKYNNQLSSQEVEKQRKFDLILAGVKAGSSGAGADGGLDYTQTADTSTVLKNPEFIQALGSSGLTPREVDLVKQYYNSAKGDVPGALGLAQDAMSNPEYNPMYPNNAAIYGALAGNPMPSSGLIPRGASGRAGALDLSVPYENQKAADMQRWQAVIEFLTKYSNTWNPVATDQTTTDKSSSKTTIR